MSDAVIVALIGLAGSGIGAFGGVVISSKLTQYRLEQLEKKVEVHNGVIDRVYKLEGRMDGMDQALTDHEALFGEKIAVANHRIEDLEKTVGA